MASSPQELEHSRGAARRRSTGSERGRTPVANRRAAGCSCAICDVLGGEAALDDGDLRGLEIGGAVCLASAGALSVVVLFPWATRRRSTRPHFATADEKGRGWFFTLDARKLTAEFGEHTPDQLADMHLALAEKSC